MSLAQADFALASEPVSSRWRLPLEEGAAAACAWPHRSC